MGLKLGLNLGYWGIGPQGDEASEIAQAAERAGFDSVWAAESYGSDVVSVLAWLAPADGDDPARRRDHAGSRAGSGRRGDGRRARSTPSRAVASSSVSGPPARRSRRAGTASRTRSPGAAPASTSRSSRRSSRARIAWSTRASTSSCRCAGVRRGQGAQAQLPPAAEPDPDLPGRDWAQVGRARRGDRRRLDPDLLLGRQVAGDLGRAHRGRPGEGRTDARRTSRSHRRSRSRSTATSTRPAAWSRPGLLLYLGGMG